MRPIWTGGISFGLIYIPVKLYSATQTVQLDLDYLNKKELNPIRYARIDTKTGKEIAWKDVVKGFEYQKGDYVVLENEDFEKADVKKSKNIEIESFVDASEIDPIYFEKPYYLEPDKGAEKIYSLLLQALKKTNKVGVAEFVLRTRENLCILKPYKNILVLNQLRYSEEIKSVEELNIPKKSQLNEKEMDLAMDLINKMEDKFEITEYKDDYIKKLKKQIELKRNKKDTVKIDKKPELKATEVEDLMEQLRASLEQVNK